MTIDKSICRKCGKVKTRIEKTMGGAHLRCRPCWAAYMREFNKRPGAVEKKRARDRALRLRTLESRRDYELRRGFGITLSDYEAMLAAQMGGCAICGATKNNRGMRLSVDHCHATGQVRGLLCGPCNNALGLAKDNPERLRRMADYLERSRQAKLAIAA